MIKNYYKFQYIPTKSCNKYGEQFINILEIVTVPLKQTFMMNMDERTKKKINQELTYEHIHNE